MLTWLDITETVPTFEESAKAAVTFADKTLSFLKTHWTMPLNAALILLAGYLTARIVCGILSKRLEKASIDKSLSKLLVKALKITFYVVAVISALGALNIPTTGLIAAMSAAAVAVSLAIKDSLSNISGGIFLLITRPFATDDLVEIAGYVGKIKEIQLIHTVLLTYDNREVIIPNSAIISSTIVNMSKESRRRVDLVFSISYGDDPEKAKAVMLKTALSHPKVISKPDEPFARVCAHSASSVDIALKVWCLADDYWDVYFDMLEQVKAAFDKNDISVPFNQLDVHIDAPSDK